MPTIQSLPGAEDTLIAEFAQRWNCSITEAEERLVKMALEKMADPGIQAEGNVYRLPSEA